MASATSSNTLPHIDQSQASPSLQTHGGIVIDTRHSTPHPFSNLQPPPPQESLSHIRPPELEPRSRRPARAIATELHLAIDTVKLTGYDPPSPELAALVKNSLYSKIELSCNSRTATVHTRRQRIEPEAPEARKKKQ